MDKTYIALMKAANHIEANPDYFNFATVVVPKYLSQHGCAIGWTAYFFERTKIRKWFRWITPEAFWIAGDETSEEMFGVDQREFFIRMERLQQWFRIKPLDCALALREYAARYHGIPESVQRIFQCPTTPSPSPVKSLGGLGTRLMRKLCGISA